MPTQYIPFHSTTLFNRAEKAAKNLQGVEAAILCVATAEAFLHDLTEWLSIAVNHKKNCPQNKNKDDFIQRGVHEVCYGQIHQVTDEEVNLCNELLEAEAGKKSIDKKYIQAANTLGSDKWEKGCWPLQPFIKLVRIRNDIVHVKGNTLFIENGEIVGYPQSINCLILEKMIEGPCSYRNWLNLLDTKKFCSFSIKTVKDLIESFHMLLPETYMSKEFVEGTRLVK